MREPSLTMACDCGAVAVIRDVPFAEIQAATAALEAEGWGFDERGFVVCPACAGGPDG